MSSINFLPRWIGLMMVVLGFSIPTVGSATVVRLQTSLGNIDIQLYDESAPLTVANFLAYINSGAYTDSFIHRSVPGFIIQGGGFKLDTSLVTIPSNPPVVNEFSASRSNLRGTIAMAKLGSDPNSATNQWFFNLADNSSNLNNQNGGFTVFGKVIGNGMATVDAIAALSVVNAGGAFTNLPIIPPISNNTIYKANLVNVDLAFVLNTKAECLFNWAEQRYNYLFAPANFPTSVSGEYSYRYYSATDAYLGVSSKDNHVYYLGPDRIMQDEGDLSFWLPQAGC